MHTLPHFWLGLDLRRWSKLLKFNTLQHFSKVHRVCCIPYHTFGLVWTCASPEKSLWALLEHSWGPLKALHVVALASSFVGPPPGSSKSAPPGGPLSGPLAAPRPPAPKCASHYNAVHFSKFMRTALKREHHFALRDLLRTHIGPCKSVKQSYFPLLAPPENTILPSGSSFGPQMNFSKV